MLKLRLTHSLILNETQMNSFLRKHDVTKYHLFAGDYPLYNQTFSVYYKTYPPPTGDWSVHIPGDKADYWSDAAAYHIQWILTDPSRKKGDLLLTDVLDIFISCEPVHMLLAMANCSLLLPHRGTEQLIVFLYTSSLLLPLIVKKGHVYDIPITKLSTPISRNTQSESYNALLWL